MSEQISTTPTKTGRGKARYWLEELILIVLLILSLLGIGITEASPADGFWYWMVMILVFALCAIIIGFFQPKREVKDLLLLQFLHWGGSMLAVAALFSIVHSERMREDNGGLVILLILALATFLDGIRIGWRFSMVGLFLGATAVIVAHFEQFMLISLLLAIIIVAFTIYWEKRKFPKN